MSLAPSYQGTMTGANERFGNILEAFTSELPLEKARLAKQLQQAKRDSDRAAGGRDHLPGSKAVIITYLKNSLLTAMQAITADTAMANSSDCILKGSDPRSTAWGMGMGSAAKAATFGTLTL